MKYKIIIILPLLFGIYNYAKPYDFQSNGIYYSISSNNTVCVTRANSSSYSGYSSITIPQTVTYSNKTYNVTSIGYQTFISCTSLTSVTMPNGITSIGDGAFSGCSNLRSLNLPNTVTYIGDNAFYNCSTLVNFTLPNNLTTIGERAFYNCSQITGIVIPNSVNTIGDFAFNGCSSITQPLYNNTLFAFLPRSFSGTYSIQDGIEIIAGGAFDFCQGLTGIVFPNSVTSIGNSAFASCRLTSLVLPDSIVSIGNNAFEYCQFTTLTLSESIQSIGGNAFNWCSSLSSVYFKGSTPPFFGTGCFVTNTTGNKVFYVPCGSLSDYQSAGFNCDWYDTKQVYVPYLLNVSSSNDSIGTATITRQPTCAQSAIITATANTHYYFSRWSDGNTSNPRNITIVNDTIISAIFEGDLHSISANGVNGTISGCGSYHYGSTATLTANSITHYHFSRWSDGDTTNPRTITVVCDSALTAEFDIDKHTISVNGPNGSVNGGGIYDYGSSIYITATPNTHYYFSKWSDGNTSNPRSITVVGNATFTAIFEGNLHTISANGANGIVSGGGKYHYGSTAVLSATPNTHFHFVRWSDGDNSNPRTVNVSGDATYTAIFEIDKLTVSDSCVNGSVAGVGEYDYGSKITINPLPDQHYSFVSWQDGDTSETRSFVLTRDTVVTALFDLTPYTIFATCENGTVTGSGVYRYPNVVTLAVEPDEGYMFVEWDDGNEYNPRIFVAEENITIEAICQPVPAVGVDDVKEEASHFYLVGYTVYNPYNELIRVYSAGGKLIRESNENIEMEGWPAGAYVVVDNRGNSMKVLTNHKY